MAVQRTSAEQFTAPRAIAKLLSLKKQKRSQTKHVCRATSDTPKKLHDVTSLGGWGHYEKIGIGLEQMSYLKFNTIPGGSCYRQENKCLV